MSIPNLTPLTEHITAYSADVIDLMPRGWEEEILACARNFSNWQTLDGASVTSRETQFNDSAPPLVGVVTGDRIAEVLPWLDCLYRGTFLSMANSLDVGIFEPAQDLRAATNINSTPRGARYEWHVDSNPLTALLFATSHPPEQGGQLIFRPDPHVRSDEDWEVRVSPRAGTLLLFDAREAAHVVTQLEADLRISVPMNYYLQGNHDRPEDLDGYLYA